jgi:hypothetical protein
VSVTAERHEARRHERGLVDRRLIASLQIAEQPPGRDTCVPFRFSLRDQDRQLEQLGKRRPAEGPERRLGDQQVPAFDRSLKGRPRMALRGRGAFPGPDGWGSLTVAQGQGVSTIWPVGPVTLTVAVPTVLCRQ